MLDAGKILGLILLSAFKFFLAPSTAVVAGYSFIEIIIITSSGGIMGFLLFFKFGKLAKRRIQLLFKHKQKVGISKKNRRVIKLKNKYGLYGLAILTPCLLSVPIGALVASRYFSKDKRTIPVFLGSIVIWSVLLTSLSKWVL